MKHHKITLEYTEVDDLSLLSAEDQDLISKAKNHLKNAYAPYSNFSVASALILADGQVVLGSNQENASYPLGLCGERVALFSAQSLYPEQKIITVAITVLLKGVPVTEAVAPCGACRQVLIEIQYRQNAPIRLLLNNGGDKCLVIEDARDLLPISFHKGHMDIQS